MRQAVNILMLGGAKRVSMGRMLIEAGKALGLEVNLFSYELTPEVPIAEIARVIVGLRWGDPAILSDLHDVVEENRIDIILPFLDRAVEVAARYCASDGECWTPGMDAAKAALLFDKVESDSLFRQSGFPLPANAMSGNVEGRVIAKPRNGSASKGIRVLDRDEFLALKGSGEASGYLCQEYVENRAEYTVDCYVSTGGTFVCAVPRERLEVSGGEVSSTVTIHDEEMELESRRILKTLDLRGASTLQFLRDKNTGRLMLMEINPRLGGGAVCSVHAGAALPRFILADWLGEPLRECTDWAAGVKICRYPQEVIFGK